MSISFIYSEIINFKSKKRHGRDASDASEYQEDDVGQQNGRKLVARLSSVAMHVDAHHEVGPCEGSDKPLRQ